MNPNATFDMLKRLHEQRLIIYAVLHDQPITKPSDARVVDITDEQWPFMESIVRLLNRAEEYPTLYGIYSILFSLTDMHLAPKDTDCPVVATFKTHVSDDLKRGYKLNDPSILCKSMAMVCTRLIPDIKPCSI